MSNTDIDHWTQKEISEEIDRLEALRFEGQLTPATARRLSLLKQALAEIKNSRFEKWHA